MGFQLLISDVIWICDFEFGLGFGRNRFFRLLLHKLVSRFQAMRCCWSCQVEALPGLATPAVPAGAVPAASDPKAKSKRKAKAAPKAAVDPKETKEKETAEVKEPKPKRKRGDSKRSTTSEKGSSEHLAACDVIKVLTGETRPWDLYQAKRRLNHLEGKGQDASVVSLEQGLRVANAASMLLPAEVVKVPLDQVKASQSGFVICISYICGLVRF